MNPTRLPAGRALARLTLRLSCALASASLPAPAAEQGEARSLPVSPHERVVERVAVVPGFTGEPVTVTNRYVELADNLAFWDETTGNWRPSVPEVVIEGNGAAALRGHQKVRFAGQVNDGRGAVHLWTLDGANFRSSVLGLRYFDAASGQQALLATVQDAAGELLPPNQIIYRDAFEGLRADVLYTYRSTGLEQDVILREAPPDPEDFGLLAEATTLEVLTEVFEAPAVTKTVRILSSAKDPAVRRAMAEPDFTDEALDFGPFRMGEGRAFTLGEQAREEGFLVGKRWLQPGDGRTVLAEAAEYWELVPELDRLPSPEGVIRRRRAALDDAARRQRLMAALAGRGPPRAAAEPPLPAGRWAAVADARPLLLASRPVAAEPGFVFDFETFSAATATNYTFKAHTTYYVSGGLTLTGTNSTFEAATVLKYAPTNNARLIVNTPVSWLGEPYRPVVLTARDDQTVGESITNAPLSGYYAYIALQLNASQAGTNFHLANLRIRHARVAIALNYSNHHRISHSQFYGCASGLECTSTDVTLRNVLFSSVATNFNGSTFTVRGAHLTVRNAAWLNHNSYGSVTLTNSLFMGVSNYGSYGGTGNATAFSSSFQTVGAGEAYLVAGSTNRNAGTTNLEPALAAELKVRTTYPPLVNTNAYTSNLTLVPQALRDADLPDRGYHYDPIDHAVWWLRMQGQSVLTITNGTVIASFGSTGATNPTPATIWLADQASLCAEGTPARPVVFARYAAVQERSLAWGGSLLPEWGHVYIYPSTAGSVGLRFCEYHGFRASGTHWLTYQVNGWFKCQNFLVRDSTLHGASCWLGFGVTNWLPKVSFVNNVFTDSVTEFLGRVDLELYNNLFLRGEWWFDVRHPDAAWVVRDNVFQSCNVVDWSGNGVSHSHNAYLALANWNYRLLPFHGTDVLITNPPPFVTLTNGYVGRWFHGSTALVNKGSRTAAAAVLADYTTQPTQQKEGATTVDIGFHQVASGPAGPGLAGYWSLNEGAGTQASDASGYNSHGTLVNGPAWTTGRAGTAVAFDGVNDYASVPDVSSLRLTTGMTVAFWMRKNADPASQWIRLVGKGVSARNYGVWDDYISGKILFQFLNTGSQWQQLYSTTSLSTGVWHHVACTWDGAIGRIYLNGVQDGSGTMSGTPMTSADPLTFGYVDYSSPFPGTLDEVAIYSRALSASEVAALAGAALPGDSDGDGLPDYKESQAGNCFCEVDPLCQANLLPEVTLVSPASGTVPSSVTLQATASDPDGTISQVAFYAGTNTTALATVSSPTGGFYQANWAGVPLGRTAIYARAHDNRGGYRDSRIHIVERPVANPPPVVTITSPANGATFGEEDEILIRAKAYDLNGLSEAAFYAGTNFLGRDLTPEVAGGETNFVLSVRGLRPGTYPLRVRVSDAVAAPNTAHHTATNVTITTVPEQPVQMEGYWDAAFGTFGQSYTPCHGTGRALVFDQNGNLYQGGDDFCGSGGGNVVIRRNGCSWDAPFGPSNAHQPVYALALSGSDLLVGGACSFHIGGGSFCGIAKVTGSTFSAIGDGLYFPSGPACTSQNEQLQGVRVISIVDGEVYIGGDFIAAGPTDNRNTNVHHIAKLSGTTGNWSTVGGNKLHGPVRALALFNNVLYAGGYFTSAGTNTGVKFLARLVNNQWQAAGAGVNGPVLALTPHNGRLLVGGEFSTAGGLTNANCIAAWDGTRWATINNGVSYGTPESVADSCIATNRVLAIAGRGDDIYVTGNFGKTWNGDLPVVANNIAKAAWDADRQTWTWSALGGGLRLSDYPFAGYPACGHSIAVRESTDGAGGYQVIVAGNFNRAGELESFYTARWVVGAADCAQAGGPAVSITAPSDLQVFNSPSTVTLSAGAMAYGGATIDALTFSINGATAGYDTQNGTNYSHVWTPPGPGIYTLSATAVDSADRSARAKPVAFLVRSTATPAAANDDYPDLYQDQPPRLLPVLANDTGSGGLRVVRVERLPQTQGFVWPGYGGTNIFYRPKPGTFGRDVFAYAMADSVGTNFALVSVTVRSQPEVQINAPVDGYSATWTSGMTIPVTGLASDWDAAITSVRLYTNGVQWGSLTTNPSFSFAWQPPAVGHYQLEVEATDSTGLSRRSLPVTVALRDGGAGPQATITSLVAGTNVHSSSLSTTDYPIIRDGLLDLHGRAYHPNTAHKVSWQARLHPADADIALEDFINVTPPPRNWQGYRTNNPPSNDINGLLGTLDLSGVSNAVYDLELNVRAGGQEASAWVRVAVESQLKIGRLTFAEQDAVLPVSGLPLTVIRAYDSGNPTAGDFGVGWTMQVNDLDVALDEERTETLATAASDDDPYDASALVFSRRSGGGHNVTLTLPDGRRTTFRFKLRPGDFEGYAEWVPAPGVTASLAIAGAANVIQFFQLGWNQPSWQSGGRTPFEAFDIPGWNLSLLDGTVYEIRRAGVTPANPTFCYYDETGAAREVTPRPGRPRVTRIRQRTGDHITIGGDGVRHYGNNGTSLTRTIHFERDAAGRIAALRDPVEGTAGRALVRYLYHEDTGNLLQVHRLLDRAAGTYATNRYHYDHPVHLHYITAIEDAFGVPVLRNEYDEAGRLVKQTDAHGQSILFHHDTANRTEIVTNRLGQPTAYAYDARGNITAVTNALAQITRFTYDDAGNRLTEVNALGHTNRWSYDARNLPLEQVDPLGNTNRFTYDGNGLLLTAADALGRTTTNTYNALGLVERVTTALSTNRLAYDSSSRLAKETDPFGVFTTNRYDATGNLVSSAVVSNTVTLRTNWHTHDANGNRLTESLRRTLTGGGTVTDTTTHVYDAQGRLVRTVNALGHTNRTFYDAAGRVAWTVDPLGRTNRFEYDALGRQVKAVHPDGLAEASGYDAEGRRVLAVDRGLRTNLFQYDALGRLITGTNAWGTADQAITRTVYDAAGRVQHTIDALGITNAYAHDAAGRRTNAVLAFSTPIPQITRFGYDAVGNQTNVVDALGRTNRFFYDALNRRTNTTFPDGTRMATAYDALGRRVVETDQADKSTGFTYDGLGRLIVVTNALGKITRFGYDEAGNPTNQVDALGRRTAFEYDALGRRTRRTLPVVGANDAETFAYDAAGNLLSHARFNGLVITNKYDALNRLLSTHAGPTLLAAYAYSATGRRTGETNSWVTNTFVYDSRDRLKTQITPVGTLNYTYDGNGNQLTLLSTTSGGVWITYGYDALNRLTNVLDNRLTTTAKNTAYGYDGVGNLQSVRYPNNSSGVGLTNLYQYDRLNRLTNIAWKTTAGAQRGDFTYTLGPAGNRLTLADSVGGTTRNFTWGYDNAYRLTSEAVSGGTSGTATYTYDDVGNRLTRGGTLLSSQALNFDVKDRLDNDTNPANGTAWFDANGNTTSYGGTWQYDWANRLTNLNSGTVKLAYDPSDHRIWKEAGGVRTNYLVARVNPTGWPQVVEELTGTGASPALQRVYTYGLDLISQRQAGGGDVHFFGTDGLGSTRFLVAHGTAAITDTYAYDAYGTLLTSTGSTPNHYLFAGEQWDASLGLYYNRARYLAPGLGRFWTRDTFEGRQHDPLSLHKYLYAHGNPVSNTDPSGHWSLSGTLTTAGIGASIGALSTVVANHALGRAQTTSSILMGAGLGAVLGPLAAEYAWFGVAVGGVGVASSGTVVWEVFSNPNSTYVQKVEASALLVASVWGTSVGLKYARAARTQAAEQAAAAPTTKRLFRVISENELVNVRRTGEFAVTSESSNPQPGGLPGKWFYGTRQEAEAFAAAHASENPRLVATEVTQAAIKQVFPNIDGGKTGYFVHLEDLAGAEIKWLPWP